MCDSLRDVPGGREPLIQKSQGVSHEDLDSSGNCTKAAVARAEHLRPVCLEPGSLQHGGILGSYQVTIKWGLSGHHPT